MTTSLTFLRWIQLKCGEDFHQLVNDLLNKEGSEPSKSTYLEKGRSILNPICIEMKLCGKTLRNWLNEETLDGKEMQIQIRQNTIVQNLFFKIGRNLQKLQIPFMISMVQPILKICQLTNRIVYIYTSNLIYLQVQSCSLSQIMSIKYSSQ